MGAELRGLRYELDFPRKLKNSFRHNLVIWLGASVVAGILIAVAPARTRKIYARPENRKKGDGKRLMETGAAVGLLKFAGTLLRPIIVKFVTNRMRGFSGGRPRARG